MSEFKMPSLGADMESGTLVAWRKQVGDSIHRGELIADVETDKGVIAIEAFSDGIVERLVAEVGAHVPVGALLAIVRDEPGAEAATSPPTSPPMAEPATPGPAVVPSDVEETVSPTLAISQESERVAMSPSARRLARELGVDPHTVHGTGPGGAVTRDDVTHAADSLKAHDLKVPPPAVHDKRRADSDAQIRMRRSIAAAMTRSKREIPHYYLSTTIDMHPALTWLTEQNESRAVEDRLLSGVLLIKAVARALRVVPELNAAWDGQQVVLKPQIHVGIAISLRQGGLLAPALHDADQKPLNELMRDFRDLVTRTRSGNLRVSELSDPTITVTSLGETGVESVYGVIYPDQAALVGFGRIVDRPWAIDGGIFVRPVITATLAADHRVSDGHRGGLFLATIDRLLQEPGQL